MTADESDPIPLVSCRYRQSHNRYCVRWLCLRDAFSLAPLPRSVDLLSQEEPANPGP